MPFRITDYIDFDGSGRAICPVCEVAGKGKKKNLALVPDTDGAYKCHRGCTPDEIRQAIGAPRNTTVPAPEKTPATAPKSVTVSPQKVREAADRLMEQSTKAIAWLANRGITPEMAKYYKLGVVRARVGDSNAENKFRWLPAISIPIPNHDGTAYFQKKRVAPWEPEDSQPDGYQAWSQYGIPQMVWFTHQPEQAQQTWLCEGEWDAMMLGWQVAHSDRRDAIAVACFTCGAGNVPPDRELERLPGQVITFYDLDEPGQKGAAKVQAKLKERCAIATVPSMGDSPTGWDISNALNAGMTLEQIKTAADQAQPYEAPKSNNPLRSRLISNDELLERAPDYTDWLVDDILTADELFLLAASPRAGKSLMAMTLAEAVASGGKFLGRPCAQGPVIYIRCEDSETKTKERELKQGWAEGLPVYWLDKFKLAELPYLEELVEELDAALVIFDTLSRIRDSSISESSAEMSQLLEPIQEMCKRQRCTGLLVHHTGKVNVQNTGDIDVYDTIRGSSAIRATCRGTLILAADERNYRLCVENGWGKLDLQVLLDANTLQWRLLGNWVGPDVDLSQKDRVLNYLNQVGSASIEQIAEASNLPKRSLYEVLKRLQADDLVEKRGERKQAVYVRKAIQQIQQLNSVLNSSNQDISIDTTPIQQLPESGGTTQNLCILPKPDQNFDQVCDSTAPHTPGELLNKTLEPTPAEESGYSTAIQHNSTTEFNTGTTQPVELEVGDLAEILEGRFSGKRVNVEGFYGASVVVRAEGWAITRKYGRSELRKLPKRHQSQPEAERKAKPSPIKEGDKVGAAVELNGEVVEIVGEVVPTHPRWKSPGCVTVQYSHADTPKALVLVPIKDLKKLDSSVGGEANANG